MSVTTHLFHLALNAEWEAALRGAGYRTSTLGRTVAEEGFTHCSRAHQVAGVATRFYTDVHEPLVVLEVDPVLLTSTVVDEVPAGASEAYPHVYGPLDVVAVVAAHPVRRDGQGRFVLPAHFGGEVPVATSPATGEREPSGEVTVSAASDPST